MEEELIKKFHHFGIKYKKIDNTDLLKRIYNLFINDKLFEGVSKDEYFYLGLYYEKIKKNDNEAIKYYKMAMEKGNKNAMNILGDYYEKKKYYDKAIKYYNMAMKKGSVMAMNNLGYYYEKIEKNYDEAIKYYNMAMEKGSYIAMNNLGGYYQKKKNYDEAKKYYKMAIEKGNTMAMSNLGYYYNKIEKNYDEAKKYYKMAIEKGDTMAMKNLGDYYEEIEKNYEEAIKYYKMAVKKGNIVEINNLDVYSNKIAEVKKKINICIKKILDNSIELSPKTYKIISNFYFSEEHNHLIKMQLNICKKTWIVPKKSNIDKYILEFITLLKISKMQENILPYWITKRIGGYLFI